MLTLAELMNNLPQSGQVEWMGIRPGKHQKMEPRQVLDAQTGVGLVGDRYAKQGGKRQVTLIQAEHLDALASMLDVAQVKPEILRRNIVVRGLNLLALKDKQFQIGEAVFEFSGLCHPCSRMEEALGPGGYNAMRGHGGINAKVIVGGKVALHDVVRAIF